MSFLSLVSSSRTARSSLAIATVISIGMASAISIEANAQSGGTSPAVAPDAPTIIPSKRGVGAKGPDSPALEKQKQSAQSGSTMMGPGMQDQGMMSQDMNAMMNRPQAGEISAPLGFIAVEESTIREIGQLPITFIEEARSNFRSKNFLGAASDLKASARLLNTMNRMEFQSTAKNQLAMSVNELNKISEELKNQQITDTNQFDQRLSQVLYYNAEFHRLAAENLWRNQQYRLAGHTLQVALNSLEISHRLAGRRMQGNISNVMNSAEAVANKLISGSRWTTSEVGRTLDSLGSVANRFGNQLGQRAPASQSDIIKEDDTQSGVTTEQSIDDTQNIENEWPNE